MRGVHPTIEIQKLLPTDRRVTRVALAMSALSALYLAWLISGWPPESRDTVGSAFFVPLLLGSIYTSLAASRRCGSAPRLRRAWLLIALASLAYLGGSIAQAIGELPGSSELPAIEEPLYLAFYPLMLWAIVLFSTGKRDRGDRTRLALDLGVVAIGGFAVVMYAVIGPTIVSSGEEVLETMLSVAYPVGDLVLLVALGSLLLGRTASPSGASLRLLALGLLLYVVGDLAYAWLSLHGSYGGGDAINLAWFVAIALFAIAGAAQQPPEHDAESPQAETRARASWLPYIALAVGFALLLINQRNDRLFPDISLIGAAAAMAVLVSIRQFLAQRDLLRTQGQLSFQSLHDTLTELPNRALVIDRAEQMLARSGRSGAPVAALYVDIDGFKQVNDSLGHSAGDRVLQTVAARLSEVIRGADTVGRLGGDEFVVLLENYALDAGPEMVAERICEVISQPIPIEIEADDTRTIEVTVSIGIATGNRTSADELLRDADFALYEAKAAGKNRWLVFESRMQTLVQDRLELQMDLREALERKELFVLYQPTFDLQSEQITGVEALVRWRHPRRGVVGPEVFVPIAEESGAIVAIGRWVLETACRQAAVWHRHGRSLQVAVNVSARQLDEPRLVAQVAGILSQTGLNPSRLMLEITETTLMHDSAVAAQRLRELKALGVHIAIDDFGTGYSSLAYLRQFPVDALKIDQSFVAGMAESPESKALIHTLVQLGKALGLETLGEGIEDPDQLRELQREHCDSGQGFLFSRPLPPDEVEELLDAGAPLSPVAH